MLDAEPEREWQPDGLREWDDVIVTGDERAEPAREPSIDVVEIGEINEQSMGDAKHL
jgi:hypothetical protein